MPTNDTLLFQHIHSESGCSNWVALTAARTLRYCLAHKMDYRLTVADVGEDTGQHGHWTSVRLIREYMTLGYRWIIYLDADCIIANLDADLREACAPDRIGAVWHNLNYLKPDLSHYNTGALYISTTQVVINFVDAWLAGHPGTRDFGTHGWLELGVFNRLGTEMGIIARLDNKFNAGHVSPSDNPVVLGLHGFPDRYESMKARMKELEG
jgi:hypothetical protein